MIRKSVLNLPKDMTELTSLRDEYKKDIEAHSTQDSTQDHDTQEGQNLLKKVFVVAMIDNLLLQKQIVAVDTSTTLINPYLEVAGTRPCTFLLPWDDAWNEIKEICTEPA